MEAQFFVFSDLFTVLGKLSYSKLRVAFWKIFPFAVDGRLGENGRLISGEEVASLFDQLIAFVRSVEVLRRGGSGASLFVLDREGEAADV